MVLIARLDRNLGIVKGDVISIRRTITGVPNGVTLSKAWLTVKALVTDLDAAATFQKEVNSSGVIGIGQIEDTAATSRIARLRFDLSATNTDDLEDGYVYDIQVLTTEGGIITVEKGIVGSIIEQVTEDDT